MIFNSIEFIEFFLLVYPGYLLLSRNLRLQNLFLLLVSLFFYGYWDFRFLGLLLFTVTLDFYLAKWMDLSRSQRTRRRLLFVSVVANLAVLGIFKYYDFFAQSFLQVLRNFGARPSFPLLNIILPIGISFYSFHSISYTVDVYHSRLKAEKSWINFALYVCFFPQLVAGPIARATHLLVQITNPRRIRADQVNAGLFLILWGYFQKVVIADRLALLVDPVFSRLPDYKGLDLMVCAIAFTFQIFADFSGYSDIARGLSKLMGFDLMINFRLPYFAVNPQDFWARWHISLSTWFRDYVYLPLALQISSFSIFKNIVVVLIVFTLTGLWHGASWNFVLWGFYNGFLLLGYHFIREMRPTPSPSTKRSWTLGHVIGMCCTFPLIVFGWIIFRSKTIGQVLYIVKHVSWHASYGTSYSLLRLVTLVIPLLLVQISQYLSDDLLVITKGNAWSRIPIYSVLVCSIFVFGVRESTPFIYFQF